MFQVVGLCSPFQELFSFMLLAPWLPERINWNEGWLISSTPPPQTSTLPQGLDFCHLKIWDEQAEAFLGLVQMMT